MGGGCTGLELSGDVWAEEGTWASLVRRWKLSCSVAEMPKEGSQGSGEEGLGPALRTPVFSGSVEENGHAKGPEGATRDAGRDAESTVSFMEATGRTNFKKGIYLC